MAVSQNYTSADLSDAPVPPRIEPFLRTFFLLNCIYASSKISAVLFLLFLHLRPFLSFLVFLSFRSLLSFLSFRSWPSHRQLSGKHFLSSSSWGQAFPLLAACMRMQRVRCCSPEPPHLPLHKPQGDHTDTSQSRGVSGGTGGIVTPLHQNRLEYLFMNTFLHFQH